MTATIHLMDALEFLRTLPDDSAGMVLTDPPYNIGFDRGQGWDSQWRTEEDYLAWCAEWTAECIRVLQPGRMLIVWGTLKTDTFLRYRLHLSSLDALTRQNEIIWSYNWGGRSRKNFARKHEYAWCYSKNSPDGSSDFLFNGDDVRVERKVKKNLRTGEEYTQGTIPTSVWEKNNHTTSHDYVGWHPTTKNVEMLERMIRAYSNPGDTIVDPFMGSGSTAVAALRSGRSAIGSENNAEYHAKSLARLAEAVEGTQV